MKIENLSILDVKLNAINRYQAIDDVATFFSKKTSSLICTVNVEFLMRAQKGDEFRHVLNHKSSLNLIDGSGVILGIRLINSWKPGLPVIKQIYVFTQWLLNIILYPFLIAFYSRSIPKVSGSDFIWDLSRWAALNDKSLFLLGNKYGLDPNVVEKTSLELQTNIYDLKIAGSFSGSPKIDDEKNIIESIKHSGADILLCGFGSPDQELWLAKNLVRTGCKIGIGLGGSFDFIAGVQRRAPKPVQAVGFEWLWRIFTNPRRLLRIKSLFSFLYLILVKRLY